MAGRHTYELSEMAVIEGEYVVLVEGDGHGSFQFPRDVPADVVLVRRDDLRLVMADARGQATKDDPTAYARLQEALES